MRIPIISGGSDIKMTMSHQDASGESRIDKMRKFLSSPLTRKKPNGTHTKTFGAPLDTLVQRCSSEVPIPFVVTRICQYIEHGGLMLEGVFRISGNARLIERLKSCFDQTGDAPLETEGDVPSAAALLKLFFRELPEPIIPLSMHQQFLNAVKGGDKEESIAELNYLVDKLPLANSSVLKYLSYFLTSVCEYEEHNRMSAASLGIVFGPNLFRVTDDFVGLKEQSLTNQIVTYFITDYYEIFRDEPKYYKKNPTASVDAKQSKYSMSTTDSMVASWPKLSAFPSLASTFNLRPLSVSIPTMGRTGFTLSSYAEPLDNEEHILIVDEYPSSVEHSLNIEQISDQSDKEENKEASSAMRRKRKERNAMEKEARSSFEEVMPSESKSYWKDFYFIDDIDDSVDQKTVYRSFSEAENCPSEAVNQERFVHPESFYQDGASSVDLCEDDTQETIIPPLCSPQHESDMFGIQGSEIGTVDDMLTEVNDKSEDNSLTSQLCRKSGESSSYRDFKYLSSDNNEEITETCQDAREFPSHLCDDRPAREKRFGRNHKRSGHRSYYSKKHRSSSGETSKRILPTSQDSYSESKESSIESTDSVQGNEENEAINVHPPTDLAVSCDAFPENEGSCSEQRYSWPVTKSFRDEQINQISPARQFLQLSGNSEAPLSPSAFRSYLSHRSPHLDPNLPPSPPVEQEDLATGTMDNADKAAAKLLSRKIQSLKKKIKWFEESFEASHGYRPSQAEKCQYPEVKPLIDELNQTRQELKQLKEEQADLLLQQPWSPSPEGLLLPVQQKYHKSTSTSRHSSNQGFVLKEGAADTIEESLQEALDYLTEKRKSSQRPELLEDMSKEQLTDEKLCLQKLLLQFESVHGRPSSKAHRDLMRPLYDRYRSAKRILGRSTSFGSTSKIKDATELQPILEHETMDFRSVTAKEPDSQPEEEDVIDNGNLVEENENEMDGEMNYDAEPARSSIIHLDPNIPPGLVQIARSNIHANLHELSLPELFEQQQQARAEKKRLRRVLREFELEFQKEKGRKVQRDDKLEMESVYGAYKHVRARLKLLEALSTKHGHRRK